MSQEDGRSLIQTVSARFRVATSPLRRLPLVLSRHGALQTRLGEGVVHAIYYRAVEVLKALNLVEDSDDYDDDYDVDVSMWETDNCPKTAAPTVMIYFKDFPTDREAFHFEQFLLQLVHLNPYVLRQRRLQ